MRTRIRQLRLEKGITQYELGKVLGLTDRAIGQYESGHREPNIASIKLLAEFFDVSTDYLLYASDSRGRIRISANGDVDVHRKDALLNEIAEIQKKLNEIENKISAEPEES